MNQSYETAGSKQCDPFSFRSINTPKSCETAEILFNVKWMFKVHSLWSPVKWLSQYYVFFFSYILHNICCLRRLGEIWGLVTLAILETSLLQSCQLQLVLCSTPLSTAEHSLLNLTWGTLLAAWYRCVLLSLSMYRTSAFIIIKIFHCSLVNCVEVYPFL